MICLKAIAAGFCAHLATARAESEAGSDAHELVRNHVRSPPHARLRGRGGGPVQTVAETKRQLNDLVASGRLMRTMVGQAAAYAAAKPFPHAVIDGLFPDLVIRALMSEIQERPSTGYRCYKNPALEFNKCEESKTERMGPHTVAYLSFVVIRIHRGPRSTEWLWESTGSTLRQAYEQRVKRRWHPRHR